MFPQHVADRLLSLGYTPYSDAPVAGSIATSLQAIVGSTLPGEYRAFLDRFPKSGLFHADGVVCAVGSEPLPGRHDRLYAVTMLYAACEDTRYDIRSIFQTQPADVIPEGHLQIAEDSFGNAFCLRLADPSGSVWFWDHELSAFTDRLFYVAESFVSFLLSLHVGNPAPQT